MTTNDIPAVPQFLMRETDHHVLQAMAADGETQRPAEEARPDGSCPERDDGDPAPSPSRDLASVDLFASDKAETPGTADQAAAPYIAPVAAAITPNGYSINDLLLFRTLTGYRLDTRAAIWRAVDSDGNRVSTTDRLFTTLTEEAFRLADRQRRPGEQDKQDLTIDDLVLTLSSIRRAANSIGTRGVIAFERLEATVLGFRERTRREASSVLTGLAPTPDEGLATA